MENKLCSYLSAKNREFLNKHGVLQQYLINVMNDQQDPIEVMKEIGCETDRILISGAFIWDSTPEGHCFWENLARERGLF